MEFTLTLRAEWPDGTCGIASDFWTCSAGDSFWGCCKSDPCKSTTPGTCPPGNLAPALMDQPMQFTVYASGTAAPATSSKSNTGAIAGGVVGGVVGLALIGALIFFLLRKKRNQKAAEGDLGAAAMVPMGNEKNGGSPSSQIGGQSRMWPSRLRLYLVLMNLAAPPTYSAPIQDYYQNMAPNKGHQSYHQYASHADGPQELQGSSTSQAQNRYSELPADASSAMANHRVSELPADATRISELESPDVSPRPPQSGFSTDMAKQANQPHGLGVSTGEASRST